MTIHQIDGSADDIDRIVDAVVADPSRATQAKAVLRSKLTEDPKTRMETPTEAVYDAVDEMWDNVPV